MGELEDVTRRLAAIQDDLLGLPDGPSERRYELLKERDDLRRRASEFAAARDAHRSTADLKSELEALIKQRKETFKSRAGYVMGKGGNNAGPATAAWIKLSAQSRGASGLDRLNARIAMIEDALAARDDLLDGEGQS